MRWFFGGLETFCETVEDMLPKINATTDEKRELTENNKLNLLMSLKYFFGGIKEVSHNLQQIFTVENIRQLEELKGATDFVQEQLAYLSMWLGNFRAWITNIFRLYNYYVPEVLFGKCVSKYMRRAHPDSAIYEYPLLLIMDIFDYYLALIEETQEVLPKVSNMSNETISMQQNEIEVKAENETNKSAENFLSLKDYFLTDRHEIIENAIKLHTWQNCLKMYAVETVARQIKHFFMEF